MSYKDINRLYSRLTTTKAQLADTERRRKHLLKSYQKLMVENAHLNEQWQIQQTTIEILNKLLNEERKKVHCILVEN